MLEAVIGSEPEVGPAPQAVVVHLGFRLGVESGRLPVHRLGRRCLLSLYLSNLRARANAAAINLFDCFAHQMLSFHLLFSSRIQR